MLLSLIQFWIRVPLMAPEDMREDLIENEPNPSIDEFCADEKTWSWLASHQSSSEAQHNKSINFCMLKQLSLISFEPVIYFVYFYPQVALV